MNPSCKKCSLALTRRNIVTGWGEVPAPVLFISDAPSKVDELIARPLAGPGLLLLRQMLTDAGHTDWDFFVTSVVMCHACGDDKKPRDPSTQEALACAENVFEIIDKVAPDYVVFLGKVAERFYKKHFNGAITILHPSYLIKTGGVNSPHYLSQVRKLEALSNG